MQRAFLGALILATSFQLPAKGLSIEFDYTYLDFEIGSTFKESLEFAADAYGKRIHDELSPIVPGDGASWRPQLPHPSIGDEFLWLDNPIIPADTIIIYVGSRDLPADRVAEATSWSIANQVSSDPSWLELIQRRGQGATTGPGADDYAPWGGVITFDTHVENDPNFWFGEKNVFNAALHEIGHVLGFGISPSFSNKRANGEFNGPAAVAAFGGPVPMADVHYAQRLTSESLLDGEIRTVVMNSGYRDDVSLTRLDAAVFRDIGWDMDFSVDPPPPPMPLGRYAESFAMATVGPEGPRDDGDNQRWFTIAGDAHGELASYAVARFDTSQIKTDFNLHFGEGNWEITDISVGLTQANASFTEDGPVSILFTDDDQVNLSPLVSPLAHPFEDGDFPDAQWIRGFDFVEESSGAEQRFFLYEDLSDNSAGGLAVLQDILDDDVTTLLFVAADDRVAATYDGIAHEDLDGPTLLVNARYVKTVIQGDFDADCDADGADFLAWQRGESPDPFSQSDLARWEADFGRTTNQGAQTAIPEPATMLLTLLVAPFSACARSTRTNRSEVLSKI